MNRDGDLALTVPAALVDAIAVRVVELLGERAATSSERTQSPYLDVDEVAAYIRAGSKQRIHDLIHAGGLQPIRDGRRVLLRRTDLDAMLEAGT